MVRTGACAKAEWTPEPRSETCDGQEVGADGTAPLQADGITRFTAAVPVRVSPLLRREK